MQLKLLDWEKQYNRDKKDGTGFDITNPVGISKDKKRTIDGIYSPLFGTELSEEIEYIERYSCKCRELKGRFYEGMTCEACGTVVEYNNNDVKKTGWVTVDDYYLINPIFHNVLIKVIGPKNLNNIIKYNKEIDKDGNITVDLDEYDPNNPFYNIGMIGFRERFDEVLNYYKKKNTKIEKEKYFKMIEENRDIIFVRRIPVFSLLLRPILMIKDNVIYADINKKYATLVTNIESLNKNKTKVDKKLIKILPNLYQTQTILMEIHNMIIALIAGKGGHIRSSLLGIRVNFSSRCVIVPLIGRYKLNEVILPYLCFLEMYKFEIINLLCKMDKITLNEANKRWNEACQGFDKRIYLIMKHIIKNTKGGVKVLVNRNPTLNYGSIICMTVIDVKQDYEDLTMSIPVGVLGILAGDFDGDVLNIVSIKDRKMAEVYDRIFNPRHMMIDKNDGNFNRKMNLIKDQLIGLYAFCN